MRPTRNNRGIVHENGSIESPHGYCKNRFYQALLLQDSCDFDTIVSYQSFIVQVTEVLNSKICQKFQEEKPYLYPLPEYCYPDFRSIWAITKLCLLKRPPPTPWLCSSKNSSCPTHILQVWQNQEQQAIRPVANIWSISPYKTKINLGRGMSKSSFKILD